MPKVEAELRQAVEGHVAELRHVLTTDWQAVNIKEHKVGVYINFIIFLP
jgi:hypothetical protein